MGTIYYNGQVYTGEMPLAEAFAVEQGRFTFVGSSADALLGRSGEDKLVNLAGAFVCAGFNDSHLHLLNYGQALTQARLDQHTGSLTDMLNCLARHMEECPPPKDGWLVGRGWNQDFFSDIRRMPNRYDLDQVTTDLPICAIRACGHAIAVNSRALEILGITAQTPQPNGGEIVMENGEPTGILLDNAMNPALDAIPNPDIETLKSMIRSACKALNAYGVTSCHSDDYCVFQTLPYGVVNTAFQELEAAGELTVRVYEQCNFTSLTDLQAFLKDGNYTGKGNDHFRLGPLKMLGDGALGARTAYLSRPYADDPTTCGIPVFDQSVLDELICCAHSHGMQVAVHAIGDACLDSVLSSLEKALKEHPRPDHRHGIVHCQITRPDQLQKMGEMRLHIYAQSIFLDYDTHIVEPRIGAELAGSSYSWRTLMDLGATVSNGTDCPVEQPFALGGIQCAVTRSPLDGSKASYLPNEAFSVKQALDSYTSAGAYASFEEHCKGKISSGMLADFVILGRSPFDVDPNKIQNIPVLATFLEGRPVWGKFPDRENK